MPLPDAEVLAVQWAKSRPAIADIVGAKVATRLPKDPEMPWLTVFRVGGGVGSGEALLDAPFFQWDCYAGKGEYSPDYETAYALAMTVLEEAHNFSGDVPGYGHILGFRVIGLRKFQAEEQTTGWARYIVETTMLSRSES